MLPSLPPKRISSHRDFAEFLDCIRHISGKQALPRGEHAWMYYGPSAPYGSVVPELPELEPGSPGVRVLKEIWDGCTVSEKRRRDVIQETLSNHLRGDFSEDNIQFIERAVDYCLMVHVEEVKAADMEAEGGQAIHDGSVGTEAAKTGKSKRGRPRTADERRKIVRTGCWVFRTCAASC